MKKILAILIMLLIAGSFSAYALENKFKISFLVFGKSGVFISENINGYALEYPFFNDFSFELDYIKIVDYYESADDVVIGNNPILVLYTQSMQEIYSTNLPVPLFDNYLEEDSITIAQRVIPYFDNVCYLKVFYKNKEKLKVNLCSGTNSCPTKPCNSGQYCKNGICVDNDVCVPSCPSGYHCEVGKCVVDDDGDSGGDCPDGQEECLDGSCKLDCDCPDGQIKCPDNICRISCSDGDGTCPLPCPDNYSCQNEKCIYDGSGSGYCGDGSCNNGETCLSCLQDCGNCGGASCGDGSCNNGETHVTCPGDCPCPNILPQGPAPSGCYWEPVWVDGCITSYNLICSSYCGDGSCNNGETCSTCPIDCVNCAPQPQCTGNCNTDVDCTPNLACSGCDPVQHECYGYETLSPKPIEGTSLWEKIVDWIIFWK